MNSKYIVHIYNDSNKKLHVFVDGDMFFSLKKAKEYIRFAERIYPDNKGCYRIAKIIDVWRKK